MNFIPLKNERLQTLLTTLIKDFFQEDVVRRIAKAPEKKDELIPEYHGCSEEYFNKARTLKVTDFGYPRCALGLGMRDNASFGGVQGLVDRIEKRVNKLGQFLGSPTNALTMAYPDRGYIGWHHNGNAPGYNILFTYSQDGDGYFKYFDISKNEMVTLPDEPGWTVKVGYYPNDRSERDRVYWHCAETKKQRISIAFILNHRGMWENMIKQISNNQHDPAVLQQWQMNQ